MEDFEDFELDKLTPEEDFGPKKGIAVAIKASEIPAKARVGRPSKFSQEIADKLCDLLANSSRGVTTICREEPDMPCIKTIYAWLKDPDHVQFLQDYTCAREAQTDFLVDEMLTIADDGSNDLMTVSKGEASYEMENKEVTNRSKIRVDVRKWIASKRAPKKYGDKLDIGVRIGKLGKDLADETYE